MDEKLIKFTNTLAKRNVFLRLVDRIKSSIQRNFPHSKILQLKIPKEDKKGNSFFGCTFEPNENPKIKEQPIDVIINSDHEIDKRAMRLMIIDPVTGMINQESNLDDGKIDDEKLLNKELEEIENIFEKDLEELKIKHDKAA